MINGKLLHDFREDGGRRGGVVSMATGQDKGTVRLGDNRKFCAQKKPNLLIYKYVELAFTLHKIFDYP